MDICAFKFVNAARGRDRQARLRQRRHAVRIIAHEPERLAVHADQAHEGMLVLGPVLGVAFRQAVGVRPDAQVRIERHQRHRRRAERLRAAG